MMSAENQKTILLVEDEVIIAMTETMTLEKFGYNVIMANSGEEAVATFEKTPGIDLILIDINLGTGIDGTEAAAIILRQRDLPVVFLSSHTEPEVVAKTEKITSYGYVVKDSSDTVLDASIKMAFKLFEAIIKEKEKESQMEAALAALRESEARLAEAQAVAKVGSWEIDLSNLNVIWSEETYRIFEIDPGSVHLTQASFLAFTHPEDCAKVDAAFLGSLDTRALNAIEHRIITPSGLLKFIEERWRIFQDDQGRPVRAVGTCQDITERKQGESKREVALAALRESEQRLRDITFNMADWVWEVDGNGVYTYSSEKGLDFLGSSRGDIIGKTPFDFMPADEAKRVAPIFSEIVANKRPIKDLENWNIGKNGERICLLTNGVPILDEKGNFKGYRGVDKDITERKQAESQKEAALEALQESEEWNKAILQMVLSGVMVIEVATRKIVEVNDTALKLIGLPKEQVIGAVCHQFVCPAEEKNCPVLDLGQEVDLSEKILLTAAGQRKNIIKTVVPVQWHGRKYLMESFVDITERKRAEAMLQESEEKFRRITEQLDDVVYTSDISGTITYISPATGRVFGWLPEEMIGKKFVEFLSEDEIPRALQAFQDALSQGKPSRNLSLKMKRRDSSVFIGEIIGSALDKKQGIPGMLGLIRDITERKQAESQMEAALEAVRKSEEKYRGLTENINLGIYRNTVGPEGKFIEANPAIIEIFEYKSKEEFLAINVSDLYQNPEDRNKFNDRMLKEGFVRGEELWLKKKDGSLFIGSVSAVGVKDKQGHMKYYDGIIDNITERKQAESQREATLEALRQSEERQQLILATLPIAIFTSPLDSEIDASWVSGDVEKVTGFTVEQYMAEKDFWRNRLHADDRERVLDAYKNPAAGKDIVLEYRWLCKDGNYKWFYDRVIKKRSRQGIQYFGIILDITARKQADEEIQRQLSEKEILLKEVHHRIKNNIASIGGLISLRLQSITNPEAVAVLQDAIGRVDSMRILYDKLLLSEGYKDIPVKSYVESLVDSVVSLFPGDIKIKFDKRIADFHLDQKQLFPLGIIINELLTNIMKYAFINRDTGLIKISLINADNHVTLTIQDNGNGLPAGFDIDESKGFGLKLVKMLSQQLGGSFSIKKHAGTRSIVEFNI